MKILYIIILGIFIFLSGFFLWLQFVGDDVTSNDQFTELSTQATTTAAPPASSIGVALRDGGVLYARNNINLDQYKKVAGDTIVFYNNSDFLLTYYEPGKRLIIDLLSEPLGETRAAAETFIKNTFGFTQDELCDMNILVLTDVYVSEYFAGKSLGVSSCPNAIELQ